MDKVAEATRIVREREPDLAVDGPLQYDTAAIEKGHTYAVQVRIETKDRLDYINDTRVEVLSRGKPAKDVKVKVIRVKK